MKKIIYITMLLISVATLTACIDDDDYYSSHYVSHGGYVSNYQSNYVGSNSDYYPPDHGYHSHHVSYGNGGGYSSHYVRNPRMNGNPNVQPYSGNGGYVAHAVSNNGGAPVVPAPVNNGYVANAIKTPSSQMDDNASTTGSDVGSTGGYSSSR